MGWTAQRYSAPSRSSFHLFCRNVATPRPPLTPRTPRETPFASPRTALGAVNSYHLNAKNEPQGSALPFDRCPYPAHLMRVSYVRLRAGIGAQLSGRVPVGSPRTSSVFEKPSSATVGTVGRRSMHVPVVPSKSVIAQPLVRSGAHADAHATRRDDAALVVRSAHVCASVDNAYDRSSSVGAVPALAFPLVWEPTSGANSASPSSASSLLSPNGFHDVGDRWEDMEDLEDMPWSASELLNAARRVESARTQKASPLSVGRALSPTDTGEKTLRVASERARSTSQLSGRESSSSPTTTLQSLSSSLCDRRRSSSARRASLSHEPKNSADSLAEAKVWHSTRHPAIAIGCE